MMKAARKSELPLFEIRARKNHPASSHIECHRQNNELSQSMQYALRWIRKYPGHSAKELERIAGCEAGAIWKVAAQLERRGLVVRKSEGGRSMKIYPV